jgi:hypothetical protein
MAVLSWAKITPAITPCNDAEPTAVSEAKFTKPYVGETPDEFNGKLLLWSSSLTDDSLAE